MDAFFYFDAEIAQKGHFRMQTNYYLEIFPGILYQFLISLYNSSIHGDL